MKKIVYTILISLFLGGNILMAQGRCSKFYPLIEGAKFTLTMYDQDNTAQGTVTYEVNEVTGDSGRYTYTMARGGTVLSNAHYDISCTDDGVAMDFNSMGGGILSRYSNIDVEVTGTNIYIPNELSVGLPLPDAEMQLKSGGTPGVMNISIKMVNRKVEGTETLTDPNGVSRECFIVSHDMIMNMGATINSHTKQWLAEGIGMMKSEDYEYVDGPLRGTVALTAYQL
ncbi:hypothetical protein GTQ34_09975 [Muricauda sp. JGD-17]|uniref:DUF3108 domain-containing protein n=1 Tax=Flagellimonas ochracea TaxID=2696472 RepID=A0A964TCA6_9FLAO|nr:hypothetical protein [Allomuricauda ochracea]NAY92247.1 hypothetical protein [Allomuricauda ochracea]